MPVVLIDANMEGQGRHIWMRLQSAAWRDLKAAMGVTFHTFREVGLAPDSTDEADWRFCQAHACYLLTSNRNADAADSLEATLRREGTSMSLPIFTLAMPDRVYVQSRFLEQVAEKLLEYLLEADNIRGTGRLYLP